MNLKRMILKDNLTYEQACDLLEKVNKSKCNKFSFRIVRLGDEIRWRLEGHCQHLIKEFLEEPDDFVITLGEAAQYVRKEKNLTLRALAEKLGISHAHLCNIENDKSLPSLELIEKIFKVTGYNIYIISKLGKFS